MTEPAADDQDLTTLVKWVRLGGGPQDAGVYYEIINNSAYGRWRNRVWQQMRNGRVVRRCLINGERIATDWRPYLHGNARWDHCAAKPAPSLGEPATHTGA